MYLKDTDDEGLKNREKINAVLACSQQHSL